jgi:ABC-type polysaccharide/polyol phosphate transport system ATPase subunit
MNGQPNIYVQNVSKKFRLYSRRSDRLVEVFHPFRKRMHEEFYALQNVDFVVRPGDILGIIGRNGSGKSTLLKIIGGISTPSSGECHVLGKVVPLLELGTGFHPDLTGRENVMFYTTILGYGRKQIASIVEPVIDFADIGNFIDQPVRLYSSGMKSRLAFSVSVFIDPEILIVDEILSVGDDAFRKKSQKKMLELFNSGKTILYVSHSREAITSLCNRAIMLDKGKLVKQGKPEEVMAYYQDFLSDKA